MRKRIQTFLILLKHKREIQHCKCEYKILSNHDGYSLYRKLLPREEQYYISEVHRLKIENGEIWLLLESDTRLNVLQNKLNKLEGKTSNA